MGRYLSDREIQVEMATRTVTWFMTSGVPQESAFEPSLWNVALSDILKLGLLIEVSSICYADEILVVVRDSANQL